MRIRGLTYLTVWMMLFSAVSCQKKVNGVRVLSEKKFSEVLTDVYLTDAMLSGLDAKNKSAWQRGMKSILFQDAAYQWVLEKHNITEADFYESLRYYAVRPLVIDDIFAEVQNNLNAMKAEADRREAERKKIEDRIEFERKWKTVYIDSAYVAQWGLYLSIDTLTLEKADSVMDMIRKLADICPDETTPAYWDSIRRLEALRVDSIPIDTLRSDSSAELSADDGSGNRHIERLTARPALRKVGDE